MAKEELAESSPGSEGAQKLAPPWVSHEPIFTLQGTPLLLWSGSHFHPVPGKAGGPSLGAPLEPGTDLDSKQSFHEDLLQPVLKTVCFPLHPAPDDQINVHAFQKKKKSEKIER